MVYLGKWTTLLALCWPVHGVPLPSVNTRRSWLESAKYTVHDRVRLSVAPNNHGVWVGGPAGQPHRQLQSHVDPVTGRPTDSFVRIETVCSTCPPLQDGGGLTVEGADLSTSTTPTRDSCASLCTENHACVAFTWSTHGTSGCRLHRHSEQYSVAATPKSADGTSQYWLRKSAPLGTASPPSALAVPYLIDVPTHGVVLLNTSAFAHSMDLSIDYLLRVYNLDEMLWWFRHRAGDASPPGTPTGWDRCDQNLRNGSAMCLKGTVASAFLMGAGGVLRWRDHTVLRQLFEGVVDGIRAAVAHDGFAAAFAPNETMYRENPSYVTSWLIHGLLEADVATPVGSPAPRPIQIARGMIDWFSAPQTNTLLPEFLPPDRTTSNIPSMFGNNTGHQIYLISQGIIHHTRMATGPLGRARDTEVVQSLYEEDEWLAQLAAKNESGVWEKQWFPHNYEVTAFEAYLDMYSLTGDARYHDAMVGAWEMFRESFIHVGGSMAINEGSDGLDTSKGLWYPPKSYYLEGDPDDVGPAGGRHVTGETCGSVFWIKFNQRFHRLHPSDERYTAEIERSLLNIGIANQAPRVGAPQTGIRYFALLHGHKETMTNISTCCEGQGTRLHGSLPEYVYSTSVPAAAKAAIYVNIYMAAAITVTYPLTHENVTVTTTSDFPAPQPFGRPITVTVTHGSVSPMTLTVHCRIPAWAGPGSIAVGLNGNARYATATAGSYLAIQRDWQSGDAITLSLPMKLTPTRYVGLNRINGSERYAFEYGPTLLAAVPSSPTLWNNATNCLHIPHSPTTPDTWLTPIKGSPLHFSVAVGGSTVVFMPYFEVDDQLMTVFPCFPSGA